MTHLERARATLKMLFPKGSPFAQADQAEKLAAVFAQVTNEALERAAEACDERRKIHEATGSQMNGVVALGARQCASAIRTLKVSP